MKLILNALVPEIGGKLDMNLIKEILTFAQISYKRARYMNMRKPS